MMEAPGQPETLTKEASLPSPAPGSGSSVGPARSAPQENPSRAVRAHLRPTVDTQAPEAMLNAPEAALP